MSGISETPVRCVSCHQVVGVNGGAHGGYFRLRCKRCRAWLLLLFDDLGQVDVQPLSPADIAALRQGLPCLPLAV